MVNTVRYLIIHHTGGTEKNPLADTSHHTLEIIHEYHRSLGWGKVGYHYVIEKDGKLRQGRLDTEQGSHCNQQENGISMNFQSLGIAIAGNFDFSFPTQAQEATLKKLLQEKLKQYNLSPSKILPHRHWASKTCYGRKLSEDWARNLVISTPVQSEVQIQLNQCVVDKIILEKKVLWYNSLLESIKSLIR